TDTNKVLGFKRDGSDWTMQEMFVDTDKNRGIWVGDVDPLIPGNELYSFGYSAKLVQITGSFASGWTTRTIWSDVARGHEIRVGDIHPDEGVEIALVGYSRNVSVVSLMDVIETPAPTVTGAGPQNIASGEEKEIKLNIDSFSKVYFSADNVDDLEFELVPGSMYASGTLTLKIKAMHVAEQTTKTLNLEVDYGSGKMTVPIEITIGADTTAPEVSGIKDAEDNSIGPADEVMWNSTIRIEFSEPISQASFDSAKTSGTLKLEIDSKVKEAVFQLSADRRSILVDLEPMELSGTATLYFDGLKDDAGVEIDQQPIDVKVKGKASDDENGGMAWIIIILVLIVIVVLAVIIYFAFLQKKEGGREERDEGDGMPPEPKQI
ncbi:MAG: hypothetical protein JXA22_09330, partial [Candidatus Thermoplasmatota archaeon]|nr:hypothetical protein [Candidatus Thermoplasmatota archaeon]